MPGSLVSTRSSFSRGEVGAVGDADLTGVDRAADADAAAVVDAHPRGARTRVDEAVQERPVGDRVRPVDHRLGLAVGRGDRARVEVIAADHDRRLQFTGTHHLIEAQPEPVSLPVAEPADPRRQALERDTLAGHRDPAVQTFVVGELVEHGPVGGGDVGRIARQGDPTERTEALAEQRADVGREEARVVEGTFEAAELGFGAQAVAVVEHLGAGVHEPDHRLAVGRHRRAGAAGELGRIVAPQFVRRLAA